MSNDTITEATLTLSLATPTLEFRGVSLDLTQTAPAGLVYLLTYGYRQALQDSIANLTKKEREEGTKQGLEGEDLEDYIAEKCAARMADKASAIAEGTITLRASSDGIPQSAFERERETLIKAFIEKVATSKGLAIPRVSKKNDDATNEAALAWWERQIAGALAKFDASEGFSTQAREIVEKKKTLREAKKNATSVSAESDLF